MLVRTCLASLGLFGLFRLSVVETYAVGPFATIQGFCAQRVFGAPVRPIDVTVACSGTDVIALCLGAILAYPVAWRRRLTGAAGGLALILTLNVTRIGTLGQASGSPAWFEALHLYVWPAVLVLAVAGYVFWWMRSAVRPRVEPPTGADAVGIASHPPGRLTTRFVVMAATFLAVFFSASPFYLESATVLQVAAFIARATALLLRTFGVAATATTNVLGTPQGAYLVTQECIATPLLPIYLAAVAAYAQGWRLRLLGLVAAFPLFVILGITRLLVVAVPVTIVASPPALIHAFFQIALGVTLVVIAAIWREGATRRALRPALLGLAGSVGVAWLFTLTPIGAWHAAAALPVADYQGAVAFAPVFQVGLYAGLLMAGPGPTAWRRALVGLGVLLVLQVAFIGGLHLLAQAGITPHIRDVRGWAVAVPLVIFFIVAAPTRLGLGAAPPNVTGGPEPGGAAHYRRFWADVGANFPNLDGAISTRYYRENERRLLTEHLAPLAGMRLFKTDLWDEAKNTRILQWAGAQGATPFGVDISLPTVRGAREAFAGDPIHAAQGDVRCLPWAGGSFDAVYSMGTIEHFDETEQAVAEILRVLRPGGRAIIGVPNRYDPFLRAPMVAAMQAVGLYAYGYEKSYSRRSLRRMLEHAGFQVRAETAILFIPGWLRMLDLACHAWCPPLSRITGALVWPFMLMDRYLPFVRRHGYLLATVAEKPADIPSGTPPPGHPVGMVHNGSLSRSR